MGAADPREAGGVPWEPLPDRVRDPSSIATGLDAVMRRLGGTAVSTIATVVERWADIVGGDLAEVSVPLRIDQGCLTVATPDAAYTTEIRFREDHIRREILALTGDSGIERIRVVVGRRPR